MTFRHTALASLLGIFLAGCAAYGPPRVAGEKIHRAVPYAPRDGRTLKMDLYVPPGGPTPVVIWIFGGSWKFGSRAFHVNVRDLTRVGIAVAAIDYRLSGEAIYPAQLEDCQSALAWLRENGARYGLDPARIGVAGESAGGHLAALLGVAEGRERIRAVCAIYPVTDLVDIGRQYTRANPSDIERLLGGPIEQKLAAARQASPLHRVNAESPPFLLIHGLDDTLVPIRHSERMHRALLRHGVESRLFVVKGKGHWFHLPPQLKSETAAFFQAHLDGTKKREPAEADSR